MMCKCGCLVFQARQSTKNGYTLRWERCKKCGRNKSYSLDHLGKHQYTGEQAQTTYNAL